MNLASSTSPTAEGLDLTHCPKCQSASIRASRFRVDRDLSHLLSLQRALRCRECDLRFYGFFWQKLAPRRPRTNN